MWAFFLEFLYKSIKEKETKQFIDFLGKYIKNIFFIWIYYNIITLGYINI